MRYYVDDKNIWVSVDETTDVVGRYVVNIVIGTMEARSFSTFHCHTEVERIWQSSVPCVYKSENQDKCKFIRISYKVVQLCSSQDYGIKCTHFSTTVKCSVQLFFTNLLDSPQT